MYLTEFSSHPLMSRNRYFKSNLVKDWFFQVNCVLQYLMSLIMFSLIEIEKPKKVKPVLALVCLTVIDLGSLYAPLKAFSRPNSLINPSGSESETIIGHHGSAHMERMSSLVNILWCSFRQSRPRCTLRHFPKSALQHALNLGCVPVTLSTEELCRCLLHPSCFTTAAVKWRMLTRNRTASLTFHKSLCSWSSCSNTGQETRR